jgi:uncharacterized HhH-GPD family protein
VIAPTLPVTGDPAADRLLVEDPLALLIGMLLDQQVPIEWAFSAPLKLCERLGGRLDAHAVAAMDLGDLEVAFSGPPALHRYPAAMAKRTQQLCHHLVEEHGGDAAAVWTGVESGEELFGRVRALPGYGIEKAKIFTALLAKRFGIRPPGWEVPSAPFSDGNPRSVADVDSPGALVRIREFRAGLKAQGKGKDG